MAKPPVIDPLSVPRRARARPGAGQGGRGCWAWWSWPHLLGLDASVVALVWQDWWSRSTHTPLASGERLVLGLGVWLIYLADRLADVARGRPEDAGTARHLFAAAWRRRLSWLGAVVAGSLVMLAPWALPAGEFRGGMWLLGVVGVYFWAIHRGRSTRWTRRLPKEAVVGGTFAVGTAFFALGRGPLAAGPLAAGVVLFGVVCFLNCALITAWERSLPDRRDPASLLNAFPRLVDGGLGAACWLTAGLAFVVALAWHALVLVPVVPAAAALACLDRERHRLPADALRCLADGVLLTPCVCALCAAVYQ